MLRLSLNICSKAVFRHQSTTFKLPSRILLIPKRFENLNACAKFSTNPDEKPKVKIGLNVGNTEHIYHGILSRQIRAVKVFSLTSSIAGLFLQPMLYEKSQELGGIGMTVAVCSIVGFFTFVTPLLLHLITRKYVIDMEYDHETETYTASTIAFLLYTKRFHFKPEDVNIPDALGMFTSCHIRGTPLFFDMRHFTDAEYYAKIMGYDKPMDFKLGEINIQESNEPKKQT